MNKKILIITYYFPPSGGSGVQRWLKFVKYLPEFGWEPIVLTVDEKKASYPQIDNSLLSDIPDKIRVEKTNTCEILNFYKHISPEKEIPYGGFSDEQKPSFFKKLTRFIRGNFFLPDPRRGWNKFAYKKACKLIVSENISQVVTTSPPHSTQLIGLKLKKKFPHIQWIADLRDPWTDIHYYKKLYPVKIAAKINEKYERKMIETADKIVVTCRATQDVFLSKSQHVTADKFAVITNGFDEDDFLPVKNNSQEKFTITYIGILYNTQDIQCVLSAFATMKNKDDCRLRFVGHSGIIVSDIEKHNLQAHTEILPQVKHSEAVQLMADSSVLVLLVPDKEESAAFLPGKLFEYLASRRPILCIAPSSHEITRIIAQCDAGKTFSYSDAQNITVWLEEKKKIWEIHKRCEIENKNYLRYSRKEITKELINFIVNSKRATAQWETDNEA